MRLRARRRDFARRGHPSRGLTMTGAGIKRFNPLSCLAQVETFIACKSRRWVMRARGVVWLGLIALMSFAQVHTTRAQDANRAAYLLAGFNQFERIV